MGPRHGNRKLALVRKQLESTKAKQQLMVSYLQDCLFKDMDYNRRMDYYDRYKWMKSAMECCLKNVGEYVPKPVKPPVLTPFQRMAMRKRKAMEQTTSPKVPKVEIKQEVIEPKTLLDLPDEIIVKILGYLSTRDLINKASLVCKRFEQLSRDPDIALTLHLRKDTNVEAVLEFVCQRSYQIGHIFTYYKTFDVMNRLTEFIPYFTRLKTIHFHTYNGSGLVDVDFIKAVFQRPTLTRFSTSSLFGHANLASISEATNLQHVKIDYSEVTVNLLDLILNLKNLRNLEFGPPTSLTADQVLEKIFNANLKNLSKLRVILPRLDAKWPLAFEQNRKLTQLKTLIFSQAKSLHRTSTEKNPVTLDTIRKLMSANANLCQLEFFGSGMALSFKSYETDVKAMLSNDVYFEYEKFEGNDHKEKIVATRKV